MEINKFHYNHNRVNFTYENNSSNIQNKKNHNLTFEKLLETVFGILVEQYVNFHQNTFYQILKKMFKQQKSDIYRKAKFEICWDYFSIDEKHLCNFFHRSL